MKTVSGDLSSFILRWSIKNLNIILSSILIAALVPFGILFFYIHPSADDFLFAVWIKENGFWAFQKYYYLNWTGRYTATILFGLHPLIYSNFFVIKIILFSSFFIYLFITYFFLKTLLQPLNKRQVITITLIFFVLYVTTMPSTAQGLFWYGGFVNYQLPSFLLLLQGTFLLKYFKGGFKKSQKCALTILIILNNTYIVGCTETLIPSITILFISIIILHKLKFNYWDNGMLFTCFCLAIAITVVILAPGNSQRISPSGSQFFFTIFNSTKQGMGNSLNWLSDSPILIITLVVPYYLNKFHLYDKNIFRVNRWVAFILFCILFLSSYAPAYWGIASTPPLRALNAIYFIFLISWFWLISVWTNHLICTKGIIFKLSKHISFGIFIIIFLMLFFKRNSNVRITISDLASKRAYNYDKELKARYLLFVNDSSKNIKVKQLQNIPSSIYFSDIGKNKFHWNNEYYAKFFGKDSIVLE